MCAPREPNIMSVLQEINENLKKLLEQFVDKNKPTNQYDMTKVKEKWDKDSNIPKTYIECIQCHGSGKAFDPSTQTVRECYACHGEGDFLKE